MKSSDLLKRVVIITSVLTLSGCEFFFGNRDYYDDGPYERNDVPCVGLPENAVWNSVDEIDQFSSGEGYGWHPSAAGTYNEDPSESECRFICKDGYEYNGGLCTTMDLGGEWSLPYSEPVSWKEAVRYCEELEEKGFTNWRLPTISDLRSLITGCAVTGTNGNCRITDECHNMFNCYYDINCYGCEENVSDGYSKLKDLSSFWSYTESDQDFVWIVNFKEAKISRIEKELDSSYVRCFKLDKGQERVLPCAGLPQHASWNSVDKVTQTWDGSQWTPSSEGQYNIEPGENRCRFVCENKYIYDEKGLCIPESSAEKWSDISSSAMSWEDAAAYCEKLDEDDYLYWRVPNITELRKLICNCDMLEETCEVYSNEYDQCLNPSCYGCGNFYDLFGYYSIFGDNAGIWSSTTRHDFPDMAWYVDFNTASIEMIEKYKPFNHVRCIKTEPEYFSGKTIQKKCTGLLPYTRWNYVDEIVQTWSGNGWTPSEHGVYSEKGSDKECRFKCVDGMVWNDIECVPENFLGKWSKKSAEPLLWNESVKFCDDLVERDHSDWRLPSISELRTLVINCKPSITGGECGVTDECLTASCSTGCQGCEENSEGYSVIGEIDTLWSVSSVADETEKVWSLRFYDGRIIGSDQNTEVNFARCVR